jgi:hypothetical protein
MLTLAACDARSLGARETVHPTAGPVKITITVYGQGGDVRETWVEPGLGEVRIAPAQDEPDPPGLGYVVMAQASGYYTRLFPCAWGETLDVQLDAIPERAPSLTGVILRTSYFAPPSYHAGRTVTATSPEGATTTLTTDGEGRYRIAEGAAGTWQLAVTCDAWEYAYPYAFAVICGPDTSYLDLFVEIDMTADAPNLYLYPPTTTDVTVSLEFPLGGEVVLSDPPYADGWSVRVAPDGTIDGTYPYLFYEARLPHRVQRDTGWVIARDDLEAGLSAILEIQGFTGREVTDFLDYWLPLMTTAPWYGVHPMAADDLVTLAISPAPDRVRRLWLLLDPLDGPRSIPAPAVPPALPRDGFVAVEWGAFLSR